MHHSSTVDWMELLHRAARAPFKASAQEGSGLPGGDWVAADLEEHGRRRTATAMALEEHVRLGTQILLELRSWLRTRDRRSRGRRKPWRSAGYLGAGGPSSAGAPKSQHRARPTMAS